VCRIESGEDITTRIRSRGELYEERGKQVMKFLFIDVPEVEIKEAHRGPPSIAQGYDVLYDGGTG